jgi:hypothetical protein
MGVLIMQLAVHQFLHGIREALTIWFALVGLAVGTIACLLTPGRIRQQRRLASRRPQRRSAATPASRTRVAGDRGRTDGGARGRRARGAGATGGGVRGAGATGGGARGAGATGGGVLPARRDRHRTPTEELSRYAEEVAVAAARAGVTARRRREDWLAAQRERDEAWRAYEEADAAARRVLRAAAFGLPTTPGTPREFVDRERYLHRTATDAYRRGELALEQLNDALAHRNGWDPRRHPFEQEAVVRRAGRHRLLRIYQTTAAMERAAWYASDMASIAKRSLDNEAYVAATRARHERGRHGTGAPARRRWPWGAAQRPTLAIR